MQHRDLNGLAGLISPNGDTHNKGKITPMRGFISAGRYGRSINGWGLAIPDHRGWDPVTIDFILRKLRKSSLELGRASPELQPYPVLRRPSWDGHRAAEQELWSRLGLCCPWTLPPRCRSRIWDQDPTADDQQADRTFRNDFVTVNAHRTLLNIFVTERHRRCFSRARRSPFADVERKASSYASSYHCISFLVAQGAATAGYVE